MVDGYILISPEGNVFVLLAYEVNPENVEIPDFDDESFLAVFTVPEGWIYSMRVLEEELILDTTDIATVLAIRTDTNSTWQMR